MSVEVFRGFCLSNFDFLDCLSVYEKSKTSLMPAAKGCFCFCCCLLLLLLAADAAAAGTAATIAVVAAAAIAAAATASFLLLAGWLAASSFEAPPICKLSAYSLKDS